MLFSKEAIAQWCTDPITKEFKQGLRLEREGHITHMLSLVSTGDELTKDFYYHQGAVSGIDSAIGIINDSSWCKNKEVDV
jgi:hypothetical protein